MLRIKSKQIVLLVGDILVISLSLYLALFLRLLSIPTESSFMIHFNIFVPIFLVLLSFYFSFDFYDFDPLEVKLRQFSRLVNINIFVAIIGFVYFYLFSTSLVFAPKTILILYTIISTILMVMWRFFLGPSFLRPQKKIKTLLIAQGDEYQELKNVVNSHNFYPFYFVSHLDINEEELGDDDTTLLKLKQILDENEISQVVVDIRDARTNMLLPYLYNLASQRKIHVFDAAMVYQDILKKMPMRGVGHFWFFESVHLNINAYEAVKRFLDIVLALPVLAIWIVLHPFVSLAIKLDSKGDVFIAQERYGFGGKIIKLYKYRTMSFSDSGKWLKDKDNTNKVTKVGFFLRKSRLDELPQVLSIILGDLSFIGPRPDMLALGGQLSATIPFYMMRYTVRPGLSGWAQTNQISPPQSLEETKIRLQYDLYYVKNRSLLLDLVILFRTVKVLVLRTGM